MPTYAIILYIVSALCMFAIAALCIHDRERTPAKTILALFAGSLLLWMLTLYIGFYVAGTNQSLSVLSFRFAHGFGALFAMLLPLFFYFFPSKTIPVPKWLEKTHITIGIAVALICSFTPYVYTDVIVVDGWAVDDVFGPLYAPIFTAHMIANYIFTIVLAIAKVVQTKGAMKNNVIIAAIGTGIFLGLILNTNVVLPLLDIYILQLESPSFVLFFLFAAFYATHRYRFFYTSNYILRYIRLSLIASAGIITVLASYYLLTREIVHRLLFIDTSIAVIVSATLGTAAVLIAEKYIPELVTHTMRELRNALQDLADTTYACTTYQGLREAIQHTFVIQVNLTMAKVFFIDAQHHSGIETYAPSTLTSALEKSTDQCIRMSTARNTSVRKEMEKLGADTCMGLMHGNELIGMLVLGTRANTAELTTEEIDNIKHIRQHLAIALTNILLAQRQQKKISKLESIVEEKTERLRKQNKKIKEFVERQSDFINMSSHELKNAFSQVLYAMRSLVRKTQESTYAQETADVMHTMTRVHRMADSIFNAQLLELEHAKPHYAMTPLSNIVKSIEIQLAAMVEQAGCKLTVDTQSPRARRIPTDQALLMQLVQNLVQNAIKFSPRGSTITIMLSAEKHTLSVRVIDHGPGVPNSDKKKIFEKFHRSTGKDKHTGMGLGLYTCRMLAGILGGRIWIEDTPGGGATFCVELVMPDAKELR